MQTFGDKSLDKSIFLCAKNKFILIYILNLWIQLLFKIVHLQNFRLEIDHGIKKNSPGEQTLK